MPWSVDTLNAHLIGLLNQDRNATGGTVPDRFKDTVKDSLRYIWTARPWRWQVKIGTLTIAADAVTAQLPLDFRMMDSGHVSQVDTALWLAFTDNVGRWQVLDSSYDSNDTSPPILATVKWDASENSNYIVSLTPPSDKGYEAKFAYLIRNPLDLSTGASADNAVIEMPEAFAALWRQHGLWQALEAFDTDAERIARAKVNYRDDERRAVQQHDQLMKAIVDVIERGYGDEAIFGTTPMGGDLRVVGRDLFG